MSIVGIISLDVLQLSLIVHERFSIHHLVRHLVDVVELVSYLELVPHLLLGTFDIIHLLSLLSLQALNGLKVSLLLAVLVDHSLISCQLGLELHLTSVLVGDGTFKILVLTSVSHLLGTYEILTRSHLQGVTLLL